MDWFTGRWFTHLALPIVIGRQREDTQRFGYVTNLQWIGFNQPLNFQTKRLLGNPEEPSATRLDPIYAHVYTYMT